MPILPVRIVAAMDLHDPMEALDPLDSQEDERAKSARKAEIDGLKIVAGKKATRFWLAEQIRRAAFEASSFDQNPQAMAFKEGVKWFAQRIIDDLKTHCPDRYLEMLKESLEHDRPDAARSRSRKQHAAD